MKFTFSFSDSTVVIGTASEDEAKAVELFTKIQGKTPVDYFKDVIDAAIKTAVAMVNTCGGIDAVSDV